MTRLSTGVAHLILMFFTGASCQLQGTPGDTVTLPCDLNAGNGNETPFLTWWYKDGNIVANRNHSTATTVAKDSRFSISDQQNLTISNITRTDEGSYYCSSSQLNLTHPKYIQLFIVGAPAKVVTDIRPTAALENGTLVVVEGADVIFGCSAESYPSQNLFWVFEDAESGNVTLGSGNGSSLEFRRVNIQPGHQGLYSCVAQNLLSNVTVTKTTLLLVYHAPDGHHICYGSTENDSSMLLHCNWTGGYPAPMIHWTEELDDKVTTKPVLNVSKEADSLEVTLNQSLLYDGQTLKCQGHYQELDSVKDSSCTVILKAPYPEGEPLVTAVEGSNITLICEEKSSYPVAKITWRRMSSKQENIVSSSKHVISQNGPIFQLTIVNVTRQDEGIYFCRSEHPIQNPELEINLTVKSSAGDTGGIIGAFLAVLILGAGMIVGLTAYRNRDRICLGNTFNHVSEDRTDVLNLVESDEDDEEIIADTRIITAANGHVPLIVQVHCFMLSDNENQAESPTEEAGTVTSAEQPELTN